MELPAYMYVCGTVGFGAEFVTPLVEVAEQWQKWLQIGKCGGDKNKLKAEAQRRFPEHKVTLKTSDALLILDYAMAREGLK